MRHISDLIKEPLEVRQSHLNLNEHCKERGGNSTAFRGLLAEFLDTNIPKGSAIHLCHACHNDKCSNPKHLYWGSAKENVRDAINNGSHKSVWDYCVEKHGLAAARELNRRAGNQNGAGNKGRPKSVDHKRKIANTLKRKG